MMIVYHFSLRCFTRSMIKPIKPSDIPTEQTTEPPFEINNEEKHWFIFSDIKEEHGRLVFFVTFFLFICHFNQIYLFLMNKEVVQIRSSKRKFGKTTQTNSMMHWDFTGTMMSKAQRLIISTSTMSLLKPN